MPWIDVETGRSLGSAPYAQMDSAGNIHDGRENWKLDPSGPEKRAFNPVTGQNAVFDPAAPLAAKAGALGLPAKRLLWGAGILGALGLVLAGIAFSRSASQQASSSTPAAAVTAGPSPRVSQLQSTLSAPVTTYTVTAADPDGGALRYEWAMAGEQCGTPRVPWRQSGPMVRWSHSDQPPDLCQHKGTDHDVTVSVTITTSKGVSVQCAMTGTETQAIANPKCQ